MSQQDGSWSEGAAPAGDGDQDRVTPPRQSLGQGYAEETRAAGRAHETTTTEQAGYGRDATATEQAGYGHDTAAGSQAGNWHDASAAEQTGYAAPEPGYAQTPGQQSTDTSTGYTQSADHAYGQPTGQIPYSESGQRPEGQQEPTSNPSRLGQQAQRFSSGAGAAANGARQGIADLFSDLQFKKSLTERLASIVFLGVIVWAVLRFISDLVYNFGSDSIGGLPGALRHMGTGTAIITTITQLVSLIVVIIIARLLLELAIHVARIAHRRD